VSNDRGVIDFISEDPSGAVVLIMVEGREWDGSDAQLIELQKKIDSYVTFVKDGHLVAEHPELAGKPVRIELRSVNALDRRTAGILAMIRVELASKQLDLSVKQLRKGPT
jgi:hypothetical protein